MPRLIYFVPCHLFARDADTNTVTLAGILESLTLGTNPGDDVSGPGKVSLAWAIAACWHRSSGEDATPDQRFEQRIQLKSPEGKALIEAQGPFTMPSPNHRSFTRIDAFPVDGPGTYSLVMSLRREGEAEWEEAGDFPIAVTISGAGDGAPGESGPPAEPAEHS